jgi:Na+(H+)/acetate symporter ActP
MSEVGEGMNAFFWFAVAIVSLIPLIIFSISYKRVRSRRILLPTLAFGLFFIKAILLSLRLYTPESQEDLLQIDNETWWIVAAMLDICIMGLISAGLILKPKKSKK